MASDDLDKAISGLRGEVDHSALWAELDRDNEIRRECRAKGIEPPTTWGRQKDEPVATPLGFLARCERRYKAFEDAVGRFFDHLFAVIGILLAYAVVGLLAWWLLAPIFQNELHRQMLAAAIIGGLVVKYVL